MITEKLSRILNGAPSIVSMRRMMSVDGSSGNPQRKKNQAQGLTTEAGPRSYKWSYQMGWNLIGASRAGDRGIGKNTHPVLG